MIYCIGNSHANTFTGTHPGTQMKWNKKGNFASISLGAIIAYNFMNSHFHKTLHVLDGSGINKSCDYVLLAVGEVDCRVHIPRQMLLQNKDYRYLVKECLDRYVESYDALTESGYKMLGYGSHPSTSAQPNNNINCDSPIFGSPETRNSISLFWNEYLGELCEKKSIPFLSVIDNYLNENNETEMSDFMDYCHLNPDSLIPTANQRLQEIGIL